MSAARNRDPQANPSRSLDSSLLAIDSVQAAAQELRSDPLQEETLKEFCVCLRQARSDLQYLSDRTHLPFTDAARSLIELAEQVIARIDSLPAAQKRQTSIRQVRSGIVRHRDILQGHLATVARDTLQHAA